MAQPFKITLRSFFITKYFGVLSLVQSSKFYALNFLVEIFKREITILRSSPVWEGGSFIWRETLESRARGCRNGVFTAAKYDSKLPADCPNELCIVNKYD